MSNKSEVRDGMRIDWDVPITMDDGVVLRADIFRPLGAEKVPAILTYGPYGKGLAFQEGYKTAWDIMARDYPDALEGSSNLYQSWEVPDPEKWVPDGYACVRIDSRGAGRSEGYLSVHSPRETKDIYDCIEWLAEQPWCTGKVGMNGISYFAANQWRVAAKQPPHLAAICIWEGFADNYRDATHHGGILSVFRKNWQDMQVKTVQHGLGERGPRSRVTGELVCGPETIPEEELAKNRADMPGDLLRNHLDGDYYRALGGDLSKITVPLLSAGNWGGQGLHLRGNVEGFLSAASEHKWLEMHGGAHWAEFYTDYGIDIQKRFLGYFLKGEDNGWDKQPKVQIQIRRPGEIKFPVRHEHEWPIARTQWTKFYLDPAGMALTPEAPTARQTLDYEAMGDGATFLSAPLEADTEITGPSAAKLFLSSRTRDADVFLVLRVFDPQGEEVVFYGALDPHTPVGQGWLRASHRKLDPARSLPYRPYHPHDEVQPLTPGEPVELDVEIWPTCIVVPKGYRIGLTVRGRDYEWDGAAAVLSNMKNPMKGCGPFVHDDPQDRPMDVFGGTNTLHFDAGAAPYLLLPVIPG
ncbi:MAG: peptidase S15 [Rhizobiales bacterium 35-68-8]|nr:MAG: peptidase S15 [Rhizobiales bacterium 35-68-8]